MRRELIELAGKLARDGQPFAIAAVVTRQAPSSAQQGDTALVTADGRFHGWVGGSCTRPAVVAEALRALADGRPRLIALSADPQPARAGVAVFPMTCRSGGSVEIHIQPVLPAPRLVVYGLSPAARALVRVAAAMGYEVDAVDPAADAEGFPGARRVATEASTIESPAPRASGGSRVYAAVATQGEWDEEAVLAALALRPDYLGVVASGKRFSELRDFLGGRLSAEELRLLDEVAKAPAGLDLGARAPEEIAVSILAEIVQRRPVASAAGAGSEQAGVPAAPTDRSSAPAAAIDPVCGMSVATATAKHRAEHQGQAVYFCCGGCRAKFLAAPERYLGQPAG